MPLELRGRPLRILAWLAAGMLAGCDSLVARYHMVDDAPRSSELRRVVLLPMNVDRTPIPALAPGAELVGDRIRTHLEAKGYEVVAPPMSETLALWKECIANTGGLTDESGEKLDPDRYAKARSDLARRTLESHPADGLVASAVVLRDARYVGDRLSWDGVSRAPDIDITESNRALIGLRGHDLGISVRTSVFDRDGRMIFERYVGLEPLRRFRVKEGRPWVTTRPDLFQNESVLAEGVTLSFEPWLSSGVE